MLEMEVLVVEREAGPFFSADHERRMAENASRSL